MNIPTLSDANGYNCYQLRVVLSHEQVRDGRLFSSLQIYQYTCCMVVLVIIIIIVMIVTMIIVIVSNITKLALPLHPLV